jgi:hypothetical protein
MRVKRLVTGLLMILIAGIAVSAFSANVDITIDGVADQNNPYTLQSISIDQNGNVQISVTSNGTPPPPCSNTKPTITIDQCPASVVNVGDALTATFTTGDQDGDTVTVTDNLGGTVAGNTWDWTASSVGSYTLILTANDGQSCNNTATASCSFTVTDPNGGGQMSLELRDANNLLITSLPAATEGQAYNNGNPYVVNMYVTGGTGPYNFACRAKRSSTTTGIDPVITTEDGQNGFAECTLQGTPAAAGEIDVLFKVTDSTTAKVTLVKKITVNPATVGGNEPPGVVELLDGQGADFQNISAGATRYYKCNVPAGQRILGVYLGTRDWSTNQDLIVSYGLPYPTPSDYVQGVEYHLDGSNNMWANIQPESPYTQSESEENIQVTSPQPGWYYIMVHNTSSGSGKFWIVCDYKL